MATPEALKKVDDLKETGAKSLDDNEKKLLNSLSKSEIESKKGVIESKVFDIDGKKVSLPQIVKDMKISPDRTKSTLYGKPIARESELGAAIQLYVIIHNKSVGKPKIDGKVGPLTNEGIADTQTDVKAENRETVPQSGEKIGMNELSRHVFTKEFNALGKTKLFKEMKLLTADGYLNFQRYGGDLVAKKGDGKITYVSKEDGKQKSIDLRIKRDVNDMVDCTVLAKDIMTKVDNAERALRIQGRNESVVEGVDEFKNSEITDPLIRKWAELKKISFEVSAYGNGRIVVKDKYGKKICGDGLQSGGFKLYNTELMDKGVFDKKKFNAVLSKKCHAEAVKAVKEDVMKTAKGLKRPSSITNAVNTYTNACDNLLNEINGYDSKNDFVDEIKEINKLMAEYEKQNKYLETKKRIDGTVAEIMKLGSTGESFLKNFDAIYSKLRLIVVVEKDPNIKYKYTINYRTKSRSAYAAAGKAEEYNKTIDKVVNIWKNIREGGDLKYSLDIKK